MAALHGASSCPGSQVWLHSSPASLLADLWTMALADVAFDNPMSSCAAWVAAWRVSAWIRGGTVTHEHSLETTATMRGASSQSGSSIAVTADSPFLATAPNGPNKPQCPHALPSLPVRCCPRFVLRAFKGRSFTLTSFGAQQLLTRPAPVYRYDDTVVEDEFAVCTVLANTASRTVWGGKEACRSRSPPSEPKLLPLRPILSVSTRLF